MRFFAPRERERDTWDLGAEAVSLTPSLNKSNFMSPADKSTLSGCSVYKPALHHILTCQHTRVHLQSQTQTAGDNSKSSTLFSLSTAWNVAVITIMYGNGGNQRRRRKLAVVHRPDEPVNNPSQLAEAAWGWIVTFRNNITEANCYDYHNDYH